MSFRWQIGGLQRILGVVALTGVCALGLGRGYAEEEKKSEGFFSFSLSDKEWAEIGGYALREKLKDPKEKEKILRTAMRAFFSLKYDAFTAAGYKGDVNGNGELDYNEVIDIEKTKFKRSENVVFFIKLNDHNGKKGKFSLEDEKGNKLSERSFNVNGDKYFESFTCKENLLPAGKYKGIWIVEGIDRGIASEFEVGE